MNAIETEEAHEETHEEVSAKAEFVEPEILVGDVPAVTAQVFSGGGGGGGDGNF